MHNYTHVSCLTMNLVYYLGKGLDYRMTYDMNNQQDHR